MRVDLIKWLFIGSKNQKEAFYEKAQQLGIVEFIHAPVREFTPQQQQLIDALKILHSRPPADESIVHEPSSLLAQKCIDAASQIQHAMGRIEELNKELEHVAVLGDFSLSTIKSIAHDTALKPHFIYAQGALGELPERVFEISTHEGTTYCLWFAYENQELPEGFFLMQVSCDGAALRHEIQEQTCALQSAQAELDRCKGFDLFLKKDLANLVNKSLYDQAVNASQLHLDQNVFTSQGWVPTNRKRELDQLLDDFSILAVPVGAEEGELIPTCLQNRSLGKLGEDLLGIYDVPSSADKDPSLWVLGFFALFFSMIIGDGGYGLIFLLATLYAYYKVRVNKGLPARLKRLALILSCSCIAWGFLANSFFGLSFAPTSQWRQMSAIHKLTLAKASYHWQEKDETYLEMVHQMPQLASLDPKQPQQILERGVVKTRQGENYVVATNFADQIMRECALLIGALHLFLSLARYARRNWASWGWMIFIVGGWLYFPQVVKATTFVNYVLGLSPELASSRGLELVYAGIAASVGAAVIQNGWMGLLEIMNLIQVFADAMSYLRLYALGLAGGIMGATFNELGAPAGLVIGTLIAIAGHTVNIVLSIMSGVIHGLRLNFLEWYHYSFAGGGRWYRPLKKMRWDETLLP